MPTKYMSTDTLNIYVSQEPKIGENFLLSKLPVFSFLGFSDYKLSPHL